MMLRVGDDQTRDEVHGRLARTEIRKKNNLKNDTKQRKMKEVKGQIQIFKERRV